MRNKQRYHTVYQTSTIDQKENLMANYRYDNCQGAYRG